MHFDPAIAAQQALHRAEECEELESCRREVTEAEEIFSTEAGPVAKQAYEKASTNRRKSSQCSEISGVSHLHYLATSHGRDYSGTFSEGFTIVRSIFGSFPRGH